jgi:hypothetical protein
MEGVHKGGIPRRSGQQQQLEVNRVARLVQFRFLSAFHLDY